MQPVRIGSFKMAFALHLGRMDKSAESAIRPRQVTWTKTRSPQRTMTGGAMSGIFSRVFGWRERSVSPQFPHWLDTTPVTSTDKPCTVRNLKVAVRVRGIYAEVSLTITIANPNGRPLSTALAIPLPDRAVVCGYALEIDGQLVDGVVVPKEQARVIFETEQRRLADPGLVEAVRGNVYSTRVYPVPAHGTRRIRLSYVAPLLLGARSSATLDLPMPGEHLDRFAISVVAERLDAPEPVVHGLGNVQMRQLAGNWCMEAEGRDLTPTEPIRVEMPALPASFTLLERDAEGTTWFCTSTEVPVPEDGVKPTYDALYVLWDASGSRAGRELRDEARLLQAYASAASVRQITLVVFADRVREVRTFKSAEQLVACINDIRYDGGTDFLALSRSDALLGRAQEGIAHGAACVLFTDGVDTLADGGFSLPTGCSVLTILSGAERDAEALRQGCRGPVLDLTQAPQNASDFARALTGACRFGIANVEVTGGADVCDVSAPDGSRRAVIGRLLGEQAQIRIGEDGAPITLQASEAQEGSVLGRAWAARRIALLSPRANENADELLTLGRRFGMASPATSLLVLETLDQWLRYELEPPRTFAQMHDAWEHAMKGRMLHTSTEERTARHRADLAFSWQQVMDWWKRDFSEQPVGARGSTTHQRGARVHRGRQSVRKIACPFCGTRLDADGPYCYNCGSPLNLPQASAPMPLSTDDTGAFAPVGAAAPTRELFAMADSSSADGAPSPTSPAVLDLGMAMPRMASRARRMAHDVASPEGPSSRSADPSMRVSVEAWAPDAPYLQKLNEAASQAGPEAARDAYFAQRDEYRTSPSFFLDCASWFMSHDDEDFGASVLTNLVELRIEDAGMLRVMAWRLREADKREEALVALRRLLRLRGEDSQSHRDLALLLAELARAAFERGDEDAAKAYAEEAGVRYRKVALTPWQRRPMAIGLFAVEEYNVLRAWSDAQSWQSAPELPSLGEDLDGVPDCDLRITLAWDADETDVDIHVTEPSGEEAYYGHRNTSSGGRVSEDITDGYGPELYEIRAARAGTYRIRAHYFASHQQTVFGPATCTLTVYSDWGRPNQTQRITSTRLDHAQEMMPIGTACYGPAESPEKQEHNHGARSIEPHMNVRQVERRLGPAEGVENDGRNETRTWTLENGHQLAVLFRDGAVCRVTELMPWGDQTILLS